METKIYKETHGGKLKSTDTETGDPARLPAQIAGR
jgi:hypothetical protein